MFGRFSAYLFLETYATLIGCDVTDINIDWPNGDTATSGLLNLFGYDAEADIFDKTGKLKVQESIMDKNLDMAKKVIGEYGGDINTTKIETSLCAYRKFYKGTRYNGYYLDRMLEELIKYSQMTRYKKTTDELFEIMKEYMRYLWNAPKRGQSQYRLFEKVLMPNGYDEEGNIIYYYNQSVTYSKQSDEGKFDLMSL